MYFLNNRTLHEKETHLIYYFIIAFATMATLLWGFITLAIVSILWQFLWKIHISGPKCVTTNDSPTKDTPCAIPFKFLGKLREGCITETDPDGRYWCSTKIDEKLDHIQGEGNWGYCTESCPLTGIVL